jgi:hypothetical protein
MPEPLTQSEVSVIVFDAIREGFPGRAGIKAMTTFEDDLGDDAITRRLYCGKIKTRLLARGFVVVSFDEDDCDDAETIADLIATVWKAFKRDCRAARAR